jgi:hypothetical protein
MTGGIAALAAVRTAAMPPTTDSCKSQVQAYEVDVKCQCLKYDGSSSTFPLRCAALPYTCAADVQAPVRLSCPKLRALPSAFCHSSSAVTAAAVVVAAASKQQNRVV